MLWREMVSLKKEVKPDGTIVFVGADHALDDLRYIVMSRPKPARHKELDAEKLPAIERFAAKSHDKWASKLRRLVPRKTQFYC